MLMSLHEAYEEFRNNFSDAKIGVSKFANLRPDHVRLFKKIPHNVCVCIYQEKVRLILQALKTCTDLSTEFSGFIEQVTCNPSTKDCMYSVCEVCMNRIHLFKPNDNLESTPTRYFRWQKIEDKMSKVEIISTYKEIFGELLKQKLSFLLHTFIKREQAMAFEQLKSVVNTENIVMQLNFSENAAILHQNEIQSAHWTHSQATIFTPMHGLRKTLIKVLPLLPILWNIGNLPYSNL